MLKHFFDNNILHHPVSDSRESFVDLIRAIAIASGGQKFMPDSKSIGFINDIGQPKNLIFILIDGLGVDHLNKLDESSFLRRHYKKTINSVFPSTTATALTSMATGEYPSTHGVPGWWTYIKENNLNITTLPYTERFTNNFLENLNFDFKTIWPLSPILADIKRTMYSFSHKDFYNSNFSQYSRGYHLGIDYSSTNEAFEKATVKIWESDEQKLLSFYFFEFDKACHIYGTESIQAKNSLFELDRLISDFYTSIKDTDVKIVITADHGHINVAEENRFTILNDNILMKFVDGAPSGDGRTVTFHVKKDFENDFINEFNKQFGKFFILANIDEVENSKILGPEKLKSFVRSRFGDFIAIAIEKASLEYSHDGNKEVSNNVGHHSGLIKEEIEIPYILI